jgi:hypothetical protein
MATDHRVRFTSRIDPVPEYTRSMTRCRRQTAGALILLLGFAGAAAAQRFRLREGPGVPPRFPPANFSDGAFTH